MWYSFIPLLVVSGLGLLKLVFFRVKDAYFTLALCLSCISLCFAFESYFDAENYNAPLWLSALPIALIMMAASSKQFRNVYYEIDPAKRLFYCYDSKIKKCSAIVTMVATFGYFISLPAALYWLELAITTQKEGKIKCKVLTSLDARIVRWLLFTGLIYCVFMMEFMGSMFSTLIFSHLLPDMIDEVQLQRDTGFELEDVPASGQKYSKWN